MKKLTLFLLVIITASSCSLMNRDSASTNKPANQSATSPQAVTSAPASSDASPKDADASAEITVTKKSCENTDVGDNALLNSQTFAVDFAPFRNTCFVTTYNPEYDDPPLESDIGIYRGNKKIFEFPDQFNGVMTGCWVEAVSFQELNADGLTDIIVVGKCSGKSAPYNENVVYVNTGKAFTTSDTANSELADMKKAGEIADFVKRNQKLFFK